VYGSFVTREKGLIVPIMYVMGIQRRKAYFLKTNVMYFKSYVLSFEKECQRSLKSLKMNLGSVWHSLLYLSFPLFLAKKGNYF